MDRAPVGSAPDSLSKLRKLLGSNLFRIGIVVLSAAIIFGAWAFAERTTESRDTIDLVLEDDLYEQARTAAESGETTVAVGLLERLLADEPDHERAAALLRRITQQQASQGTDDPSAPGTTPGTQPGQDPGTQPGQDPGTGPGEDPASPDAPRDDSAYMSSVSDLRLMLPELIPEWRRGTPVADETDATVPFGPVSSGSISRATYSVHDRGSVAEAEAFVERTSKRVFSSDGRDVKVGVVDGYFGTNGDRLATVAFARGIFAFEVVFVVPNGNPAAVADAAIALAREFESTR